MDPSCKNTSNVIYNMFVYLPWPCRCCWGPVTAAAEWCEKQSLLRPWTACETCVPQPGGGERHVTWLDLELVKRIEELKEARTRTLSNSTSRHRALTEVLVMGRCIDMYMFMVVLMMVLMLYAYRMPCEEETHGGKTLKCLLFGQFIRKCLFSEDNQCILGAFTLGFKDVLEESESAGLMCCSEVLDRRCKCHSLPAQTHYTCCSGLQPACHFFAPWTRWTPSSSSRKLQTRSRTAHPWREETTERVRFSHSSIWFKQCECDRFLTPLTLLASELFAAGRCLSAPGCPERSFYPSV